MCEEILGTQACVRLIEGVRLTQVLLSPHTANSPSLYSNTRTQLSPAHPLAGCNPKETGRVGAGRTERYRMVDHSCPR